MAKHAENQHLTSRPRKKRALRPDHPDALVRRGPRTAAGKRRVAQNARSHGLSVAACFEPAAAAEVEAMARRICGVGDATASGASAGGATMQDALDAASRLPPRALFLARRIAQAQFDVKRVRLARHGLLAMKFADPRYRTRKGLMARIRTLGKAGDLLLRGVPVPPDMARAINERPQGAEKMAVILADFSKELAAMDRYERRALSRRKRAIRAFDDALSEAAAERRAARAAESRERHAADAAVSAKQFPATNPIESTPGRDTCVPQEHDRVGGNSRQRSHPETTVRSAKVLAEQFPAKTATGSAPRDAAGASSGSMGQTTVTRPRTDKSAGRVGKAKRAHAACIEKVRVDTARGAPLPALRGVGRAPQFKSELRGR